MIITKKQFLEKEDYYLGEIKNGKIFIYPTDTIYGIGCDATNAKAVEKIRKIKCRDEKPFPIIVPSKKWILNNCFVEKEANKYLKKLPGKFTLIFRLRKSTAIAKNKVTRNLGTIGVRIPNNWFAEFLSRKELTFVTTSVNISGQKPIVEISELTEDIFDKVDYVINDGKLDGRPSTLINLSEKEVEIIKR